MEGFDKTYKDICETIDIINNIESYNNTSVISYYYRILECLFSSINPMINTSTATSIYNQETMTKAEFEVALEADQTIFEGVAFIENIRGFRSTASSIVFNNCTFSDLSYAFYLQSRVRSIEFNNCYVSNKDASHAFEGCVSLASLTFDVAGIENMDHMFLGCCSLKSIDIDTSKATSMNSTFAFCFNLKEIDISDATKIESCNRICYGCMSLEKIYYKQLPVSVDAFKRCIKMKQPI